MKSFLRALRTRATYEIVSAAKPAWPCAILLVILVSGGCAGRSPRADGTRSLREALTFHASFDHGLNADYALGDRTLRHAASVKKAAEGVAGLPSTAEVELARGNGRFGDALRFTRKKSPLIFFPALANVAYRTNDWSGTVSFWLNVDPVTELEPGFCDPIQITPRAWNDAAFFVEFEKRTNAIPFRLGVYADFNVWNPSRREWDAIPFAEKPLVTVPDPPFQRGKWTHIVFTFEHFNSGHDDGVARLYLDGAPAGALSPRRQTFTWNPAECLIMLGVGYLGLWDELTVFNRALTYEEVRTLHALPQGAAELRR